MKKKEKKGTNRSLSRKGYWMKKKWNEEIKEEVEIEVKGMREKYLNRNREGGTDWEKEGIEKMKI